MDKRKLIINEEDPRTGDYGFTVYDDAHPINGDPEVRNRFRKQLRGLRGKELTVTVRGTRVTQSGKERNWSARRTIELNRYDDIFGASGVLIEALKSQMKRNSDDELNVLSLTIEEATGEDDE